MMMTTFRSDQQQHSQRTMALVNRNEKERWYFTDEQMNYTPSVRSGFLTRAEELNQRQLAAKLINEMGKRLKLSQLCMNTAIVYMHRFYMFHSFQRYHRAKIAPCALFLAAKVEEQPQKLEQVLRVFYMIWNPPKTLSTNSKEYIELSEELVENENLLLQTLGFEVRAEHPHTSIITCCQRVKATKDLTKTAYIFATNSLHLTTFCLQYKPSIVACVCIYIACKWSKYEILKSAEDKDWWTYVDENVTIGLIDDLTNEFMRIMKEAPTQIKKLYGSPHMASSPSTSLGNPNTINAAGISGSATASTSSSSSGVSSSTVSSSSSSSVDAANASAVAIASSSSNLNSNVRIPPISDSNSRRIVPGNHPSHNYYHQNHHGVHTHPHPHGHHQQSSSLHAHGHHSNTNAHVHGHSHSNPHLHAQHLNSHHASLSAHGHPHAGPQHHYQNHHSSHHQQHVSQSHHSMISHHHGHHNQHMSSQHHSQHHGSNVSSMGGPAGPSGHPNVKRMRLDGSNLN